MQRAEDNERLAVGEEGAGEVDGLTHLPFGGEGAKGHELDESLHAHLAAYIIIGTLGVLAQIFRKVFGGKVVLVTV